MASYTFRNLLIIDRSSKNAATVQAAQQRGWTFQPTAPFDYRSDYDKVIVCFPGTVSPQSNIKTLGPTDTFNSTGTPEGMFQLDCDGTNLRVQHSHFQSPDAMRKHLPMLKAYIIQSVRESKTNLDATPVVLFWSKSLPSDVTQVVTQAGLINNTTENSYRFGSADMNEPMTSPAPSNSSWNSQHFSTSFLPQHPSFPPQRQSPFGLQFGKFGS